MAEVQGSQSCSYFWSITEKIMSRRMSAMLVLAIGSVGFAVIAKDKAEEPDKSQYLYLFADRNEEGPVIRIEVGDRVLVVPKIMLKSREDETTVEVIARDKKVVMRVKSEDGYKELASEKQIAIPFQLTGQVSGASRSKVVRPRDYGPGSGDFIRNNDQTR